MTTEKIDLMMDFLNKTYSMSELTPEKLSPLYKEMLHSFLFGFHLRKTQTSAPPPPHLRSSIYIGHHTYGSRSAYSYNPPYIPPSVILKGDKMAKLIDTSLALGLQSSVKTLLFKFATEAQSACETYAADPQDYKLTVEPVLKACPGLVDIKRLEVGSCKYLLEVCLREWIVRYVGGKPVRGDWTRSTVTCGHDGKNCSDLNLSLERHDQRSGRFTLAESRRKHIQQKFGPGDYDFDTDRSHGTPYSLIVTKTERSVLRKLDAWQERHSFIRSSLLEMDQSPSLKAIPDEMYEEIMRLDYVKLQSDRRQQTDATDLIQRSDYTTCPSTTPPSKAC